MPAPGWTLYVLLKPASHVVCMSAVATALAPDVQTAYRKLADPAEGAGFELSTHYDRGGARARLHNTRGGVSGKGQFIPGCIGCRVSRRPRRGYEF